MKLSCELFSLPSHTTLYGLDRDSRRLLHEYGVDSLSHHTASLRRIEDQSHMILDSPPAALKKTSSTAASPLPSSTRKLISLQVLPCNAGLTPRWTEQTLTIPCRLSFIPRTSVSLGRHRHLKIVLCRTMATSFHKGGTAMRFPLPPASPSQGNLFNKLTQERNDRLCIRTFARPATSLYGSEEPVPSRLYKKLVVASDQASVIQDQLQMRLVELQAREKVAKSAKGGMVALPLNVTSPEDRSTRRFHNNQRYM
jgi:hypothetical protein